MNYKDLQKEIKERKDKLTKVSWRGDLTVKGLRSIRWGDLKQIEQESLQQYK